MCIHEPRCAPAEHVTDCCSARSVVNNTIQGWRLLCNGIVLFDDGYYLRPDGVTVPIPRVGMPETQHF